MKGNDDIKKGIFHSPKNKDELNEGELMPDEIWAWMGLQNNGSWDAEKDVSVPPATRYVREDLIEVNIDTDKPYRHTRAALEPKPSFDISGISEGVIFNYIYCNDDIKYQGDAMDIAADIADKIENKLKPLIYSLTTLTPSNAQAKAEEWRDIKSAPKDRFIQGYSPSHGHHGNLKWNEDYKRFDPDGYSCLISDWTHWQEKPKPPTTQETGGE